MYVLHPCLNQGEILVTQGNELSVVSDEGRNIKHMRIKRALTYDYRVWSL